MRSRVRRTTVTALAAAATVVLASCGSVPSSNQSSSASVEPSAVTGTVTFWDTSDANSEGPAFTKLVEGFRAEYPNITVEYVNVPFNEAQEKFRQAAEAGTAPDVFRAEVAWTPEFAAAGYLQPLTDTPLATGTDAYLPAAMASNEFDDELWGVPQVIDTTALLCNSALLTKAGVAVPKSWDDVKNGAAAVTGAGAAFLYGPTGGFFTMPYIYSQGGDLLDTRSREVLINAPESVAGFQTPLDLMAANAMVRPDPADPYNAQQKMFKEGQVACVTNGPWSIADTLTGPAFANPADLTVNLIPNGSKSGASPIGGHNYVVYAGSRDQQASFLFIDYMNSEQAQVQLAEEAVLLPSRKAAYTALADSTTPSAKLVLSFKPVLDASRTRPTIPESGALFIPMNEQWLRMYTGATTAQQGADAIAADWLKFLPSDYTDEQQAP